MRLVVLTALIFLAAACSPDTNVPQADAASDGSENPDVAILDTRTSDIGAEDADKDATAVDAGFTAPTSPSYGTVNVDQFLRMKNVPPEDDGPFYMVNLIRFRNLAVYPDGRETTLTGREANALYNPIDILFEIGARPLFVADVTTNLPLGVGDGTVWHQIAIVRYPTRAAFLEMIARPDFQERAIHKDAGLEKSIVLVTEMGDLGLPDDFEPTDPPFPATPEDPSFHMIHVMEFHDVAMYEPGVNEPMRTGKDAVEIYSNNAGTVAVPLGVYPVAWFEVEGELIGDGREWDEFRINYFPSGETFQQLINDPTWMDGKYHRDAGLADSYSLMTSPIYDDLTPP